MMDEKVEINISVLILGNRSFYLCYVKMMAEMFEGI